MIKQATLIINPYDSQCVNCGEGCDYRELKHTSILDWKRQDREGCGITWENVTTSYLGLEYMPKTLRPDLNYIDIKEILLMYLNAQYNSSKKPARG